MVTRTHYTELFVNRMRALRQAQGLSAQGLSDRVASVGVSLPRSAIAKLESGAGRKSVTLDEAIGVAAALGTSVEAMVGDAPVTFTVRVD